jgi:hypothetical protein
MEQTPPSGLRKGFLEAVMEVSRMGKNLMGSRKEISSRANLASKGT